MKNVNDKIKCFYNVNRKKMSEKKKTQVHTFVCSPINYIHSTKLNLREFIYSDMLDIVYGKIERKINA